MCHRLERLPAGTSCLAALEQLSLSQNFELQELPEGIGNLINLTGMNSATGGGGRDSGGSQLSKMLAWVGLMC